MDEYEYNEDFWMCPFCFMWLPPDIKHECKEEQEFMKELENEENR